MWVLAALSVVVSCALVLHDVRRAERRDRAVKPVVPAAAVEPVVPAPAVAPTVVAPPRPVPTASAVPLAGDASVLGEFPTTVERPPRGSRRVAAAALLFAITLIVAGVTAVVIYGGLQALG